MNRSGNKPQSLYEAFKALMNDQKAAHFVGEVKKVNRETKVVEVVPQGGGAPRQCRLNPIVKTVDTQIVAFPKVGSWVVVGVLENRDETTFISRVGEIDELVIDCPKVTINGGENGGLVNWPNAKTELDKLKNRLSGFETVFNAFIGTQSTVISTTGGVLAPLGAGYSTAVGSMQALPPDANFSNLEDTKVKH